MYLTMLTRGMFQDMGFEAQSVGTTNDNDVSNAKLFTQYDSMISAHYSQSRQIATP
jgi:hypothetical protein